MKIQPWDKQVENEVEKENEEDIADKSPDGPVIAEKFPDPAFTRPENDWQQEEDRATDHMEENLGGFVFHFPQP